jgi:hypothetical protein
MPTKRRLLNERAYRVTDATVAAFAAGDSLALHRPLGLKPWQPGTLDVDTPEPPAWAGRTAGRWHGRSRWSFAPS